MTEQIATAFALVADLGYAHGARDIGKRPGCWEHQVDNHWFVALNPHGHPTAKVGGIKPINPEYEVMVPPFSVYIEFNGYPAGIIDAHGGIIAHGAAANEQTFCDAVRRAIAVANRRIFAE